MYIFMLYVVIAHNSCQAYISKLRIYILNLSFSLIFVRDRSHKSLNNLCIYLKLVHVHTTLF